MTDANQPAPGGVERFEAFVRAHQDMVYATAVRILGNPAEAEDVAQTVFLKAFERFDALAESPSAAGWLKTVTKNACLNHLSRYRSRWQLFSQLASGPGEDTRLARTIAADSSPARDLELADEREQVEQALRTLPDHQRVPLVMFHFEEASYGEIASALRISVAKVKTDIHRGREALRKFLVRLKPDATTIGSKPDATTIGSKPDATAIGSKPDATTIGSKSDATAIGSKPDRVDGHPRPGPTSTHHGPR